MDTSERIFYYLLHAVFFAGAWFLLDLLFGWIFGGEPQSNSSRCTQAVFFGLFMTLYAIGADWWKKRKEK